MPKPNMNTLPFDQRQKVDTKFFIDIESLTEWLNLLMTPDTTSRPSYEHIDHLQVIPRTKGGFELIVIHHTVPLVKEA